MHKALCNNKKNNEENNDCNFNGSGMWGRLGAN